jgi:hypothetical protein
VDIFQTGGTFYPACLFSKNFSMEFFGTFSGPTHLTKPRSQAKVIDLSKGLTRFKAPGHCRSVSWAQSRITDRVHDQPPDLNPGPKQSHRPTSKPEDPSQDHDRSTDLSLIEVHATHRTQGQGHRDPSAGPVQLKDIVRRPADTQSHPAMDNTSMNNRFPRAGGYFISKG